MTDDQGVAVALHQFIAKRDHFRKVVAGVDVQQWQGQPSAPRAIGLPLLEGLARQVQYHARVFATRKQQRRALERAHRFAQDEDRLFLQRVEMPPVDIGQVGLGGQGCGHGWIGLKEVEREGVLAVGTCRPHSRRVSSSHHQRPARKSSPTAMGRVHGAQPMLGMNASCSGL